MNVEWLFEYAGNSRPRIWNDVRKFNTYPTVYHANILFKEKLLD